MESQQRSWPDRRWRQNQNLLVLPALALSARCFLPWYPCQTQKRKWLQLHTEDRTHDSTSTWCSVCSRTLETLTGELNCGSEDKPTLEEHHGWLQLFQLLAEVSCELEEIHSPTVMSIKKQKSRINLKRETSHLKTCSLVQWWWVSKVSNSPSNKSEAEPRQYSITSCNERECLLSICFWSISG